MMRSISTIVAVVCLASGIITASADTINGRSVTVAPVKAGVRAPFFYVENPSSRTGGLRIQPLTYKANVFVGDVVNLTGTIKNIANTSEPYMELSADAVLVSSAAVKPYGTSCKSLLGSPGLAGKLVRTWGKVSQIAADKSYFTINDGYIQSVKIQVPGDPITSVGVGDYVTLNGTRKQGVRWSKRCKERCRLSGCDYLCGLRQGYFAGHWSRRLGSHSVFLPDRQCICCLQIHSNYRCIGQLLAGGA